MEDFGAFAIIDGVRVVKRYVWAWELKEDYYGLGGKCYRIPSLVVRLHGQDKPLTFSRDSRKEVSELLEFMDNAMRSQHD